jgi:hypothetical protein
MPKSPLVWVERPNCAAEQIGDMLSCPQNNKQITIGVGCTIFEKIVALGRIKICRINEWCCISLSLLCKDVMVIPGKVTPSNTQISLKEVNDRVSTILDFGLKTQLTKSSKELTQEANWDCIRLVLKLTSTIENAKG